MRITQYLYSFVCKHVLKSKLSSFVEVETVRLYTSAWSVLTETEEPTVLSHFSWNRNRNITDSISTIETGRTRNRSVEPRVTEMADFTKKCVNLAQN